MNWTSEDIMMWINDNISPRCDEHYEALDKIANALELFDAKEKSAINAIGIFSEDTEIISHYRDHNGSINLSLIPDTDVYVLEYYDRRGSATFITYHKGKSAALQAYLEKENELRAELENE